MTDYANAKYELAVYYATHSVETMLTERQALALRNMGVLRSQEELDDYDDWEARGRPAYTGSDPARTFWNGFVWGAACALAVSVLASIVTVLILGNT